jgi:phosphatidylinositol glycan class S
MTEWPLRFKIVLVFVVTIALGVPVWWHTTRVYRADLPFEEISRVVNKEVFSGWPIHFDIYIASKSAQSNLEAACKTKLEQVQQSLPYQIKFTVQSVLFGDKNGAVQLDSSALKLDNNALDKLLHAQVHQHTHNGRYKIFVFVDDSVQKSSAVMGKFRHSWIKSTAQTTQVSSLLGEVLSHYLDTIAAVDTTQQNMITLKPSHEYHISFSLVNADPESRVVTWDFESINEKYLKPILEAYAPLGKFTVDSQVLHYAPLLKQPKFDSTSGNHYFTPEYLSYFLNLNEWKLDFTTSNEPNINFILYIPRKDQTPLRIRNSDGTYSATEPDAFLIPQWGGVVIYNVPGSTPLHSEVILNNENTLPIVQAFVSQLRSLLSIGSPKQKSVTVLPNGKHGAAEWELDVAVRKSILNNLRQTQHTLKTFSSLIQELVNIPVPESLLDDVQAALWQFDNSTDSCARGQYQSALKASQYAHKAAEDAFFAPNMVAMLYFPDEHKYAIYLPLFLPVLLPVFTGLRAELRHLRAKRALAKAKAESAASAKKEEQSATAEKKATDTKKDK